MSKLRADHVRRRLVSIAAAGTMFPLSGWICVATAQTKVRANLRLEDFGVVGDGRADDTIAFQRALDEAAAKGAVLACGEGKTFSVSSLTVRNGVARLDLAASTICGQGKARDAVIVLGAAGSPVKNAAVSLRIDMSGGDRVAVKGYDTEDCLFTGCVIAEFTDHPKLNHYGILLTASAKRNVIRGNQIRGANNPAQRGLLIDLLGGGQAEYGGFFEGKVTRATAPCVENIIEGNTLDRGSYAVNLLGCERNVVRDNTCTGQNHRSIYLANASCDNLIEGNRLIDYLSSGIVLGYCSSGNTVRKNTIRRDATYASGEAAININTGARNNTVTENTIHAGTNYGVYLACDVVGNVIKGNDIGNFYLAGVAIENDWKSPRPSQAIFSRPNYGAPPRGVYSHVGAVDNAIIGNTLRAGYSGRKAAAIYIAQIDAGNNTRVKGTIIQDNKVVSNQNLAFNLYVYGDQDDGFEGMVVTGNRFHEANKSMSVGGKGGGSWFRRLSRHGQNVNFDPGAPEVRR